MALRDKPGTMKETVDQLWYAMIGTNGEGLISRFSKLEEECAGNKSKKNPKRMEILALVITGIVALQSIGLLDGIRMAIAGWLSSGG